MMGEYLGFVVVLAVVLILLEWSRGFWFGDED